MHTKILYVVFIVGLLLRLPGVVQGQESDYEALKERYVQDIIDNLTPEMQAYYEEQRELYRKTHPAVPFVRFESYTVYNGAAPAGSNIKRVLLLINKTLYSNQVAKGKIDRYGTDVGRAFNCKVEVEVIEGGKPSDIRDLIKKYHANGGLDGVVIFGDIPVQWYKIKSPRFDPGSFACDHYYMDVNGKWEELNSKEEYQWHVDGDGDVEPELFCSRIHLSSMKNFGNEVDLLSAFLDKDHDYWTGNMKLPQKAAAFVQKTWAGSRNNTQYIYGAANTGHFEAQNNANSTAYINNGLKGDISFLQLWCHSSVHGHNFDFGGSIDDKQLFEIESTPIGYGIDACHIGAWPEGNGRCISGSYVFGKSKKALIILSGTRSGQCIGSSGKLFFEDLGRNVCFGTAYVNWLADLFKKAKGGNAYVDDKETKAWHYGYVLMGDPLVCFKNLPVAVAHNGALDITNYSLQIKNGNGAAISYTVPNPQFISLNLYTLQGKRVYTFDNGYRQRGRYTLDFDATGYARGLYILTLKAGSHAISKKIEVLD